MSGVSSTRLVYSGDGRHRARAARARGLPPPRGEDPRGLLLRRLLQLREGDARARGSPPAGADAGLPAQGVDPRRGRRGARGAAPVRRPPPPRRLVGGRLGPARRPRAARGRRDRAVGDGDDDRGRLLAVRPPRDGLPRLRWRAARWSCATCARSSTPPAASRSCTSPPATTTGSCRPATAGRRTSRARSASPPTRRRRGGAAAASARCRTG